MRDAVRDSLESLVRLFVMPLIRYRTAYPATVEAVGADGLLDVRPDPPPGRPDLPPDVPAVTRVPLRGLPCVEVMLRPGARVLLRFEHGNPQRPIAELVDGSGIESLKITASTAVRVDAPSVELGAGASRGVIRVGDFFSFDVATSAVGPFSGVAQAVGGSSIVTAGG